MKSQHLMGRVGTKASDRLCSRQQMAGKAGNLTWKWPFGRDKRLGFGAMRLDLTSQCRPLRRWLQEKKKKGVQKRRSIQQPICIISGTVSHTHSQASERLHLGKARERLDFKRKMFFAFQRFLMFTIPALLPTQIKDGRGNSLRDL